MSTRIVTLLENTSRDHELVSAHGLSFYIETENRKILFDLGPDESFLKNARALRIAIEDVDYVILSHGHRDHTGGLAFDKILHSEFNLLVKDPCINEHHHNFHCTGNQCS